MKRPQVIRATGLGHPEGPYELDDGRVIFANTYASEIGYWDPRTGKQGQYAYVGGGPNACMLGSDGAVYSTQTPNVGQWVAPEHRPPSIQKTSAGGKVEILVTEADGVKFDGPNDLTFGPDGRLYFTDSGDWNITDKPHPGRICVIEKNGVAHILEELDYVYPNGIVAEPDGSLVWVESYTLNVVRRKPNGSKSVLCRMPEGHIPDGLKIDVNGDFWITAVAAGGVDHFTRDGKRVGFLETGGTILNCVFGKNGKLFCCDMGPFDTTGAAMTGYLIEVDLGVEGMPLYRGAIG
ncbi:SMP-30/gluconolactonase/LRE family protein [Mesorhizobium sp. M2C.T.Ca.TU.002.02.1.1]|uniref:SMP-30/gluconolactonase/LRE family protein n=1 Tax=Mesorhizobium sp. M2C.T.Ca.TU.002.02.1.1 TaxID=2496788 RepID=UPI000FCCA728|nr:SMP-30/gluconolactonase/LRE family protein [Mesorhizobium sp. M2C.T.Ca.TU.002.02.1.1]RUU60604.1 SMP-30/gluconolactonase/LRE family protein [Mesorhizobium sp. M2C.T.Ca.TU.002.02.1.1]RUU70046.1 SMP-30/gluconolactonase/LRE family protein [Mesorhizobium sp. M2C.T.Ca.TU.009.01.2.1]